MLDTLIISAGLLVGQPDTAKTVDYIEIREQVIRKDADEMNEYDVDRERQHLRFKQFDTTPKPTYWFYSCTYYGTDWC